MVGTTQPSSVTIGAKARYFLLVLASENHEHSPWYSHSFASFIKAAWSREGSRLHVSETTLSWLPESLHIALFTLRPEPGRIFRLRETLEWAKGQDARVSAWGPYEISITLYESGMRQVERLRSGVLEYKAIDLGFRGTSAINCIHALTDLDIAPEILNTGFAHGCAASVKVVEHVSKWVIAPTKQHRWLLRCLPLRGYSIHFCDAQQPVGV